MAKRRARKKAKPRLGTPEELAVTLDRLRDVKRRMTALDGAGPESESREHFESMAAVFREARISQQAELDKLPLDSPDRAQLIKALHGLTIFEAELRLEGEEKAN